MSIIYFLQHITKNVNAFIVKDEDYTKNCS